MKVGVLIEFTSNTDIDAKFAELKEMGVDSCQLVCWDRPTLHDDAMAEAINKGLEKYGIHVTAFWCGWEGRRVWDFYEGQLTLGLIPLLYEVLFGMKWPGSKRSHEAVQQPVQPV